MNRQTSSFVGQNADTDAPSRPDTANPRCPNRSRRTCGREQGVRLHQERIQGRGLDVALSERGQAAVHSHARISGSFWST